MRDADPLVQYRAMVRSWLSRSHSGLAEIAGLAVLYAVYEVVRGAGGMRLDQALDNTASIVALEKHVHLFGEQAVQHAAESISFLPALLGVAYMGLHFLGTAAVLVWLYRRRADSFPVIRTTMIVSTALALVGYRLFPAAPPRLAGLGFSDTVSSSTGLNLSSDALGALYNPIAAVPSLHFGYALIVGLAVATLARRRLVRVLGAVYPLVMLGVIVATGNHFFFDAALGGVVALVAWLLARLLAAPAESRVGQHLSLPAH